MGEERKPTHPKTVVKFDTRVLQSHIRTSSAFSSATSPGIERRRADLDLASFVGVRLLASADEALSFRGEGRRRHNLVGKWKVFQEEEDPLDCVGSRSCSDVRVGDETGEGLSGDSGDDLRLVLRDWMTRSPAAKRLE